MKRYIIFMALVFGLASGCHAASPSFSSFYTNHFLTNGLVIKAKLNPTQFDTNASSITITITNIGDVPGSGVFTNVAGVIKPKPNQLTNALLFISGSADAATNTALTVDTVNTWTDENTKLLSLRHQGTNVAYITPYGSFESGKGVASAGPSRDDILLGIRDTSLGESDYALIYTAAIDGSSPTNYSVFRAQLNTGDGAGSILSVSSITNEVVSRFTVQLQPAAGVSRIELFNQDANVFKVDDNGSIYVGKNSYSLWGFSDLALVQFRDVSAGDADNGGLALYSRIAPGQAIGTYDLVVQTNLVRSSIGWNDGPSAGRGITMLTSPTDSQFDMTDINGVTRVLFQASETSSTLASIAHFMDTDTTWTQGTLFGVRNNGTNYITIGNAGQIGFGPHANGSATNVLYRSGSSLVVTNGVTTNAFTLRNGLGNGFHMTFTPSGAPRLATDTGFIYMQGVTVFEGNLIPDSANTRSLGTMAAGGSFADTVIAGSHYVLGSNDAGANFTRLKLHHTGNAGNIQYVSDALGTQTFRPHVFMVGSTNVAKIDTTSAAGETRFWLYDEDNGTMERVTVGAADSGGVGYKLLRIPN